MLFNSLEFLIYFPVVCILYFLLGSNKFRNPFLLIASYYFYMNWKPFYAILILTSTILTFAFGLLIEKNAGNAIKKKTFLITNLVLNLGILFTFKYYNFVNTTIFGIASGLGLKWNVPNFDILLPVGISFYTFQAIGYSIDVYRREIKAEKNFFTYALFVSFFPQLVAGPIERARNLLPQFHREHTVEYDDISEGLKQMIWGFFMKLCIADVLGEYVDSIFAYMNHNGSSYLIAAIFFTFQIYCDFAGYSHIAIGTARIMGFHLMENFKQPYFAFSIREFWKRWHISLSSWLMDYVYIPLGGNRVKYSRHLLNLFVTFLISGLWHGANWTFVVWGAIHGFYIICGNIFRRFVYNPKRQSLLSKILSLAFCFSLVSIAWIFFRANSVSDAFTIIEKIFTQHDQPLVNNSIFVYGSFALCILIAKDSNDRFNLNIRLMHSKHTSIRYISVACMVSYIILFGALNGGQFIYFQF